SNKKKARAMLKNDVPKTCASNHEQRRVPPAGRTGKHLGVKKLSHKDKERVGLHNPGRWMAEIRYQHVPEPVVVRFEEIEDLDRIIERGPDWRLLENIVITLNRSWGYPEIAGAMIADLSPPLAWLAQIANVAQISPDVVPSTGIPSPVLQQLA